MKRTQIIMTLALLLVLAFGGAVYAAPPEPQGVDYLTASPDPVYQGQDIQLQFGVTLNGTTDPPKIWIFLPTDWDVGNSDFPATITAIWGTNNWSRQGSCEGSPPGSIGGVSVTCYQYNGGGAESYEEFLVSSLTISTTATIGTNRPTAVRVYAGNSGTPIARTDYVEVKAGVTTIYASDQSDCGGYGESGVNCFQSLQSAINATTATADEVVIVGNLTADTGGATVSGSQVTLIRGINSPQLVAPSGCTNAKLLTVDKSSVTVRNFTIDGSSCSGAATGIDVTSTGATLSNLTVQNFGSGTGISFSGTGAGTIRNCSSSISGNNIGVSDSSSGAVNIGTGPSDGNTFTNNTTGISSNGGIIIKGNTISGGTTGVALIANATAFYGNSITGASGYQVDCNGATAGAAFNYLGGSSPSSGSNCSDVNNQLGAMWSTWVDNAASLNEVTSAPAGSAIFDLGSNPPFGVGINDPTGLGQLVSNFYAINPGGVGALTIDFSGTGTGRLYHIDTPGECTSSAEVDCWDYTGDSSAGTVTDATALSGHYVVGEQYDPTALTLTNVTAQSPRLWLPVALVVLVLVAASGALLVLRRQRYM